MSAKKFSVFCENPRQQSLRHEARDFETQDVYEKGSRLAIDLHQENMMITNSGARIQSTS